MPQLPKVSESWEYRIRSSAVSLRTLQPVASPQLAQQVRDAVRRACYENLELSPTVNIHIEDLHDDD